MSEFNSIHEAVRPLHLETPALTVPTTATVKAVQQRQLDVYAATGHLPMPFQVLPL